VDPPPVCSYISFDTLGSLCVSRQAAAAAAADPHRPTDWLMYLKLKRCGLLQRPNVHPAGSVTTNLFNQPFIFLWKTHTQERRDQRNCIFSSSFSLGRDQIKKGRNIPPVRLSLYAAGVLAIISKCIHHQVSTRDDFNQQQGSGKIKKARCDFTPFSKSDGSFVPDLTTHKNLNSFSCHVCCWCGGEEEK
jgi:hypothetical protein